MAQIWKDTVSVPKSPKLKGLGHFSWERHCKCPEIAKTQGFGTLFVRKDSDSVPNSSKLKGLGHFS